MPTIVSRKKNFVFIHTYKTAGTSITDVLKPYDDTGFGIGIRDVLQKCYNAGLPVPEVHLGKYHAFLSHARADQVRKHLGHAVFDSMFSFGFVRNPWDFQVSLYHYERQVTYRNSKSHQAKTFEQYIDALMDHGQHQQWRFVMSAAGEKLVSHVARFENMREELDHIGRQIGVSLAGMKHMNASRHGNYRGYYTPRTAEVIARLFQKDIETFGYKFDADTH